MQNKSNTVETASVTPEGTQHTQGNWHVDEWEYATRGKCLVIETAHDAVAEIKNLYRPDSDSIHEEMANARLIASAPELLATLKQVHAILNQPWKDCDGPKTLQIAKADCAIAVDLINTAIAKTERQ